MPVPPRFLVAACIVPTALAASVAHAQMPDPSVFAQAANVSRLTDSDATCEQLFAEAEWLGGRIAALPKAPDPMELARQSTEDMRQAQKKMMGGQRARSFGSALLGLVPGGGMAAGALSSLGGRPNTDALYDAMDKTMQAQQASMATMAQQAQLHGRREHVTELFLERSCKVSTLDRAAVTQATTQLEAQDPAATGASATE